MQLEKSDELKFIVQVYKQATIFQGKPYACDRLEQLVHQFSEQKTRDSLFTAGEQTGWENSFWSTSNQVAKETVQKKG